MTTSPESDFLVIVMPVYNEQACIKEVVESWQATIAGLSSIKQFVILLINDGSTDSSGSILDQLANNSKQLRVIHKPNGGHGSAVMAGFKQALALKSDYIFQIDSDDQFEPNDFIKLWERRLESPFILGKRVNRADPKNRLFISWGLKQILKLSFGVSIPDANIPYRLIQQKWLAENITNIPDNSKAPNIMLSILAARQKNNLLNIPVKHKKRETGQTVLISNYLFNLCITVFKQLRTFKRSLRNGNS